MLFRASVLSLFLFAAFYVSAAPSEFEGDPYHFLEEVLDFRDDCAFEILNHSGERFAVRGSLFYYGLYHQLRQRGTLHPEMSILRINPRNAQAAGLDPEQLESDRALIREYLPGLMYELLLARVAAAVGVSVAENEASLNGKRVVTFNQQAAEAYALSWQSIREGAQPFDVTEKRKMTKFLFPGFFSYRYLAGEIERMGDNDEEIEDFLFGHLRETIRFLLTDLTKPSITELADSYFGIGFRNARGEREVNPTTLATNYCWDHQVRRRRRMTNETHCLSYKVVRGLNKGAGILAVPVYTVPKAFTPLTSIIQTTAEADFEKLGVAVTIPEEGTLKLIKFLKRLNKAFTP